jgi:hypothetical protein
MGAGAVTTPPEGRWVGRDGGRVPARYGGRLKVRPVAADAGEHGFPTRRPACSPDRRYDNARLLGGDGETGRKRRPPGPVQASQPLTRREGAASPVPGQACWAANGDR